MFIKLGVNFFNGAFFSLALINRAGGLYARIFSHTDRPSSVNKMFIIWPNKKAKEQKT